MMSEPAIRGMENMANWRARAASKGTTAAAA